MKRLLLPFLLVFLLIGCTNSESIDQITNNKQEIEDLAHNEEKNNDYIESIGDVLFYIHKLKDEDYTSTYGDGQNIKIWYTAAEELGQIGKPAIPFLIKNLHTKNDYERALTLYALLLATQHENVKEFSHGSYINVNLEFDTENHEEYVKKANSWWEKYKHNWE